MPAKLAAVPRAVPFSDQVSAVSPLEGDALDGVVIRRQNRGQLMMLELRKLDGHPDNIRDQLGDVSELAESIRQVGLLQPLTVTPNTSRAGRYHVVIGNRRRAAAIEAGLELVPGFMRNDLLGLGAVLSTMLNENWYHKDVGPVEKAKALGRLRYEEGWSVSKIARKLGKTTGTISEHLVLLDLDEASLARVERKEISVAMATRAVRAARARQSKAKGGADRRKSMALTWEPDHLTEHHHLSRRAQFFCDASEHNNRRRLGHIACGACWERAIREHERKLVLAEMQDEIRAEVLAELAQGQTAVPA